MKKFRLGMTQKLVNQWRKKTLDLEIFPKIIVVDELDLMITSGRRLRELYRDYLKWQIADSFNRNTKRPSVDVENHTIKSNFPTTRISYKVVNKINSRTIIGKRGLNSYWGKGDL